jgi:hypothetical protein
MRVALLGIVLLATLSTSAAFPVTTEFFFDPPAPTDRSFVVMQVRDIWRDGCVPFRYTVSRTGDAVVVRFEAWKNSACPAAIYPWNADVPLGVFAAGVYPVTLEVDDFEGIRQLGSRTLVVTEAAPALRIEPQTVPTGVAAAITIANFCPPSVTVLVDGKEAPHQVQSCFTRVVLPAHAAGPVDVKAITPTGTFEVKNAFRYVDPAAAPDRALYERVLVPVLLNGPGAFGSQWRTEAFLTNHSSAGFHSIPSVAAPLPYVPPGTTVPLSIFGERPAGLVLFLPRGVDTGFRYHVRDISRDALNWGTEIPVVREGDTRRRIELAGVPFDPRYRLQLRVYGIDGVSSRLLLTVQPSGEPPQYREVQLAGPCSATPCNSNAPAYASLDLEQLFPTFSGPQTIAISHTGYQPPRLWAFVTVTNDDTQHVTVISPQ